VTGAEPAVVCVPDGSFSLRHEDVDDGVVAGESPVRLQDVAALAGVLVHGAHVVLAQASHFASQGGRSGDRSPSANVTTLP